MQTALRARAATHPAFCPTATFAPKRIDILFDPAPQFGADGTMVRGSVVQRFTMHGCPVPLLLTVYTEAAPGLPLRFVAGLAGTTFADTALQEQAIPHAIAAARPLSPACGKLVPIDTRLIGDAPDAGGSLAPWTEYWLVSGCGRIVNVKLHFTPDPASKRMGISADPRESSVLPMADGAAQAGPSEPQPSSGATADRIVASAAGTSLIPMGGADIPGAKVAGTCLTALRERSPTPPDSAECTAGLPAQPGAAIQCVASRGRAQGQMSVAITDVDRASGSVKFQCVVHAR